MPKRKKATGLLPSQNYRRKVFVGWRADGTKREESFTAPTAAEAEAMAAEFKVRVRQLRREGVAVEDITREGPVEIHRGPTLGEAMDAFIDTCRTQDYSPSTVPGYVSIRKNAFPQLVDKPVSMITLHDVQDAINARAADHSVKTVRNEFFLAKKVLSIYAPDLDLSRITIAKRKKPRKKVFRQSWGADVLEYAKKHESPDFYLYCAFIVCAGLRPSESYALTWEDLSAEPLTMISGGTPYQIGHIDISRAAVRDEAGVYSEKATKSEAGTRLLTVSWPFFEAVYAAKSRGAGLIFDLKPNGITKPWGRCRAALGLPDWMRYYDLRHYFATTVATSGASEDELKAIMGHSTSAFSHEVYVELFEDRQTTISAAMAAATDALFSR